MKTSAGHSSGLRLDESVYRERVEQVTEEASSKRSRIGEEDGGKNRV